MTRRVVLRRVVLVVLAVMLLWGCSSGDDKGDSGSSGTSANGQSTKLQSQLLTTSDLPAGYTQSTTTNATDTSSQFCNGAFDIDNKYPPEQKAEAEFQKSGNAPLTGSLIAEIIAQYSGNDAQTAYNGAHSAIAACADFDQTDQDSGTSLKGHITEIPSFPRFGDQTFAIQVNGELTAQNVTVPLALQASFVLQDETIIGIANGNLGPDPVDSQLTIQLTETAFQKVFQEG